MTAARLNFRVSLPILVVSAGATAPAPASRQLSVDHYRFGKDRPVGAMEWYAQADTPVTEMQRFQTLRVRFQVTNRGAAAITWRPRLEWSTQRDKDFQVVAMDHLGTAPFVIRTGSASLNGADITVADLALGTGFGKPETGKTYDEVSEAPVRALGPTAYTEVEFSIRVTVGAEWKTRYYLRLTDAGTALGSAGAAELIMGDAPPVVLTQPQFTGRPVSDTPLASSSSGVIAAAAPTAPLVPAASALVYSNPHGNFATTTDLCAGCHRTHIGQDSFLLGNAEPQANVCFTCHNGTGANSNVYAQYSDVNVPANNATTSSFYSHPATAVGSGHTSAQVDEFKGVLNRHGECSDCHNPHQADPSVASATSAGGWTLSGAVQSVTGVTVTNGLAGSMPAYFWTTAVTREYQLCFKCHSGYTTLITSTKPSYQKKDKGVELNPANTSFHPIEAPGKNTSSQMAASLSGTSPYKLWSFTTGATVRCANCHGNYRLATPSTPPATSARLSPHTSRYRSLLMNNYRDRQVTPGAYSAANFALCYQCHAEAPFVDTSGNTRADTVFRYHGKHVAGLGSGSTAADIDTPGAGSGNAICAECHYRLHSTTSAYYTGQQNGQRLVNFAPNVTGPSGTGAPAWNGTNRTCSLRCHGQNHSPENY